MENSILIQLQRIKRETPQGIYISKDLAKKLKINSNQRVNLHLGQKSIKCSLFISKSLKEKSLAVTTRVWSSLYIPHKGMIHIKREPNGLRIGPLVGILTTGIRNNPLAPVGKRSHFFRHLLSAQYKQGVFYFVFSPGDLNIGSQTVRGLFLHPRTDVTGFPWARINVPLPDVVYDRVPNRTNEKRGSVQSFKKYVNDYKSIQYFNPGFFNKWEIHQMLANKEKVSQYIPETYHSPGPERIEKMLNKHKMVYLKPAGGSLGLGIIKITKHPQHGYLCRYNRNGQNVLKRFASPLHLFHHIGGGRRMSRYLIQQGIALMKYGERQLDFRVHLHKNHFNEWEIVGNAAKIAGRGSVTTHIRTGGSMLSSSEAIRHSFKDHTKEIEQRIHQASIELAIAIEKAIGKPLGEIGFDMGVDHAGNVWMFEANSKPGRHVFQHPSLRYVDKVSTQRILDYSKYLANF